MKNLKDTKDAKNGAWEIKKLGEVCKYDKNQNIHKDLPYVGLEHIESNTGMFLGSLEPQEVKSSTFYFTDEHVLYGRLRPYLNKVLLPDFKGHCSTEIFPIKVKKDIIRKFLFYWLIAETTVKKIDATWTGARMPRANMNQVLEFDFAFPSLPEQRRIVYILDEYFSAIDKAKANAEQNLKNAKELFESYLQGVFGSAGSPTENGDGWEEKKLGELGTTQTGTTPKTAEKENYGNFIPFIKPADVDFLSIGDLRYNNEGLSEIGLKKGRKMENGSILMVCIGATIGKVGFAKQEVSCNQQINTLTLNKKFEPKFFYYAMRSKKFQEKVLLEGKGAQTTLPIINKSKWENLTISFPKSKNEQQTIVHQFDALRAETQKLETIYQKKITNLEELKKSILQKAFAGELTETTI